MRDQGLLVLALALLGLGLGLFGLVSLLGFRGLGLLLGLGFTGFVLRFIGDGFGGFRLGHLGHEGIDELDESHRSGVAHALAELRDAGVTAGAVKGGGGNLV